MRSIPAVVDGGERVERGADIARQLAAVGAPGDLELDAHDLSHGRPVLGPRRRGRDGDAELLEAVVQERDPLRGAFVADPHARSPIVSGPGVLMARNQRVWERRADHTLGCRR